ncbi:hypothetical protein VRRI112168_00605 [Vreelandella rituensis]|uniref:Uncharacterized protein n=1 Tax=Vreelandella rituensis TaxID=2282306 RepID=A0A368UAW9_9GAMM|nr:hypothetical protein [Halomonas rituensis]RCV93806.1 hypothetical protein DU506_01220 [Halomonas rituensis]
MSITIQQNIETTFSSVFQEWDKQPTPFLREREGAYRQAWLRLNLDMKHVDVVFTGGVAQPAIRIVPEKGIIAVPLPALLTGLQAKNILGGPIEAHPSIERESLEYIMSQDFISPGAGKERILKSRDKIADLLEVTMLHLYEMASINDVRDAFEGNISEMDLKGFDDEGQYRKAEARVTRVIDKKTGRSLAEPDVAQSVIDRLHHGDAANLIVIPELVKRIQELAEMTRATEQRLAEVAAVEARPVSSTDDAIAAPVTMAPEAQVAACAVKGVTTQGAKVKNWLAQAVRTDTKPARCVAERGGPAKTRLPSMSSLRKLALTTLNTGEHVHDRSITPHPAGTLPGTPAADPRAKAEKAGRSNSPGAAQQPWDRRLERLDVGWAATAPAGDGAVGDVHQMMTPPHRDQSSVPSIRQAAAVLSWGSRPTMTTSSSLMPASESAALNARSAPAGTRASPATTPAYRVGQTARRGPLGRPDRMPDQRSASSWNNHYPCKGSTSPNLSNTAAI